MNCVFEGDQERRLDRYLPTKDQKSWFWRKIGEKINPTIDTQNYNLPMMFKKVTFEDIMEKAENLKCIN